jgi:hypothetical protein
MNQTNNSLLTTAELAKRLCLKEQTIRNLLCTHPERLPPSYRLPGCRRVYFQAEDLVSFLETHLLAAASIQESALNKK